MYLIGMDQSWWNTPFFRHHRLINSEEEVLKLKQAGVKQVEIDLAKGLDVEDPPEGNPGPHPVVHPESKLSEADTVRIEHPSGALGRMVSGPEGISEGDSVKEATPIWVDPDASGMEGREKASVVREAAVQAVEKIFEGVVTGVPLEYGLLQETTESVLCHVTSHPQSMAQLVLLQNLRTFDKQIFDHVVDVCALAVMIGVELGWDEDALRELAMGALLHDVGYLRLPANLIKQRHRKVLPESSLLDQHAELGGAVLRQYPEIPESVVRMVLDHHERQDGSGIPCGITGHALSRGSQLLGLIDRFDSLSSQGGGRPQQPSAMVLRELYAEAKSGKFEATAVERMIRCLGVYPVGSLVELSTKERGVVTMVNPENLLKPTVKILSDEQGNFYPSPFVVDLADTGSQESRRITFLLDPAHEDIQVGKYFSLVGAKS